MNVIELTKKLVSIPSENGNEFEIADFVASFINGELIEVEKNRANIICKAINNIERPKIILNAHIDTVERVKGWTKNPYGEVEENKLYGLGASDMKAGLAIAIDVFEKLKNKKNVNIIFTACVDEEGISKGSYFLLKNEDISAELCLIPEPTNEKIMLGCRGRYVINIDVIGKSAHGARPELGVNAICVACEILKNLGKVKIREHTKIGKGSICPLKINGGTNTLSVPDFCKIKIDRHIVPSETSDMILKDFEEGINSLNIRSKVNLSLEERETPFLEPYIVDKNNSFVKEFLLAFKNFYEKDYEIFYGKSVGDYNLFAKFMPTIVFGPKGKNWHSCDEFVYIDSIKRCRDFYLYFINKFFEADES